MDISIKKIKKTEDTTYYLDGSFRRRYNSVIKINPECFGKDEINVDIHLMFGEIVGLIIYIFGNVNDKYQFIDIDLKSDPTLKKEIENFLIESKKENEIRKLTARKIIPGNIEKRDGYVEFSAKMENEDWNMYDGKIARFSISDLGFDEDLKLIRDLPKEYIGVLKDLRDTIAADHSIRLLVATGSLKLYNDFQTL